VTLDDLVARGLGTLEILRKLEGFEGHILNWYDIGTLEPLYPRYVSTVDSGNLLASLWGAGQGYRDVVDRPLIGPRVLTGMADTLGLLREALTDVSRGDESGLINDLVAALELLCARPPTQLADVIVRIQATAEPAHELATAIHHLLETLPYSSQQPSPMWLGPSGGSGERHAAY